MKLRNRKLSHYRVGKNSFDYALTDDKNDRRIAHKKLLQRALGILVIIGLPSGVFFISSAYASQQNKATLDSSPPAVYPSYDAPSSTVAPTTSSSALSSSTADTGQPNTTSVSSSDSSTDTTPSSTSVTVNKQTVQNQDGTTTTTNANVNGQPVTVPTN